MSILIPRVHNTPILCTLAYTYIYMQKSTTNQPVSHWRKGIRKHRQKSLNASNWQWHTQLKLVGWAQFNC